HPQTRHWLPIGSPYMQDAARVAPKAPDPPKTKRIPTAKGNGGLRLPAPPPKAAAQPPTSFVPRRTSRRRINIFSLAQQHHAERTPDDYSSQGKLVAPNLRSHCTPVAQATR